MNKPSHPVISSDGGSADYGMDAHAWAITQAQFLRSGQIDRIDWANVAEEIDDVARRERRAAESALRVLMMHILKWNAQPSLRSRSWQFTIQAQRLAYSQTIDENPSIAHHADTMRDRAFARARIEAAREMDMDLDALPVEPPSWSVIVERPFEVAR